MSNLLCPLVINNPFPLVVMLLNGLLIPEVSSLLVELPSITVFYLLVIPHLIGSLKTHGVPHGEKTVISDLLETLILVVSVTLLVSQLDHLSDLIFRDLNKIYILF